MGALAAFAGHQDEKEEIFANAPFAEIGRAGGAGRVVWGGRIVSLGLF